ncbi:MAG: hypothetical protein B5M52_07365 [Helicobacteraceae bacterium 4484_230]|nr:MAG: hypothetical protein B5M52_07365 [Helicobacteraceae bacterium 4484_230]
MPDHLITFIEDEEWIFAKTYAKTWPHEYLVEEKVDKVLFAELADCIDKFGHKENFYSKQMTYFPFKNHMYWHMENIINRCLLQDTYEQRKKDGRLPKGIY